jgi:site-specific DNA recombinase
MAANTGAGAVAIYARFSSDLQNPRSCADQVADLKEALVRDGAPVDAVVFTDEATSGSVWDRPGLQAMLRAVEAGRVTEVRVEHPDRLSRDLGDADRIAKLLLHHDVRLVCGNGIVLDGTAGASLSFGVTAVLSENYLRELGTKTRRGLRGNAREGKSTGGRTYGYRTGADHRVEVVEQEARVVREMFRLYADGHGYASIAAELNRRGVEAPRVSCRRAGRGWMASAIREQLRNAKYIGDWSYGVREWRKHPATRKRQPRLRDDGDVMRAARPELAIVDRPTWDTVQAKLADHAKDYKRAAESRPVLHQRTNYLFSGLLRCACCGALMQVSSGSTATYYRCSANRKRGTCNNRLAVKERVARTCILDAISDTLWNPAALEHIRSHVAERLGEFSRALDVELAGCRARLARQEQRIRGIIAMQVEGDRSPYVAETRRDFEAQALTERATIAQLEACTSQPLRLPSPQELAEDGILALDALHAAAGDDVPLAREQLRRALKGGTILLTPEDGVYVARAELLPLEVMLGDKTATPAKAGERCPHLVARDGFEPSTFGL